METGTSAIPIKRRLTAILAADAVGYSRQMSENEEATLQMLTAQRAIIDRLIVAHEGRIFTTAGDSVIAEFPSSVEAVRCAVEIQEALLTRNESVPDSQRLEFRIGVNLGDVMVDGADILGDGVNVAARLESIAEPGGICIASSVYDQIVGKVSLGFVDLGEKALKNITRPIRVYRFDRSGEKSGTDRHGSPFQKRWLGIGGAGLLILFAAGAWQAGLFEHRAAPVSAPVPITQRPISVPPRETTLEETKIKLQIAEAERAKAEAEAARSRSDAELAKQRAAALRIERKDVVPASPPRVTPSEPAKSPATTPNLTPPPATPVTLAKPGPPATLPISPPAEQPAPPPIAPAAVVSTPTPQAKAPPIATALTDSDRGMAFLTCEPSRDLEGFKERAIPVRVLKGEIVVERGNPGEPGYLSVSGRPSPNGHLVLDGMGVPYTKQRQGFQNRVLRYEGTFRDRRYELELIGGRRRCTMTIRMDSHP
jgi:class 3 adenylate cyclase